MNSLDWRHQGHTVPTFNSIWMHCQCGHNARPHARLPHKLMGMDAWMTSKLNVALVRKLRGSLMCLHNQALADVRSTGAGITCLYCRFQYTRYLVGCSLFILIPEFLIISGISSFFDYPILIYNFSLVSLPRDQLLLFSNVWFFVIILQ